MSQKGILPLIYGLMKKTIPDQMEKFHFHGGYQVLLMEKVICKFLWIVNI
jgi:hypothetical protein